jgi:transporter family protein
MTKVGLEKVDSNLGLAIQSVVILVVSWTVVIAGKGTTRILDVPAKAWPILLGAGVVTTFAYLCYFRALSEGDPSRVAPIDRLSLVFTVMLAAVFLKEKLSPLGMAGVALMAVGALFIAVAPNAK